jgi:hypothetical protein
MHTHCVKPLRHSVVKASSLAIAVAFISASCGGNTLENTPTQTRSAASTSKVVVGSAQLVGPHGTGYFDGFAVNGNTIWLSALGQLNEGAASGSTTTFSGWRSNWGGSAQDRPTVAAKGQLVVAAAVSGQSLLLSRSTDGGQTFTAKTISLGFEGLGVAVTAGNNGKLLVAVGEKMPNTGPTMLSAVWAFVSSDSGVSFAAPVEMYRVSGGSGPMIWPDTLKAGHNSQGYFVAFKVLYAGAPSNQLHVSHSATGASWTTTTLYSSRYFRGDDLLVTDNGAYATGADGYAPYNSEVYFWRYDGARWVKSTLVKSQVTATLATNGSDRIYALLSGPGVGSVARLMETADDGSSWQQVTELSLPHANAASKLVSGVGQLFVLWTARQWDNRAVQTISAPLACGTTRLNVLRASATGKEQSIPMTCGADGRWHARVKTVSSSSPQTSIRFETADQQTFGDNDGDHELDAGGNVITFIGEREVTVDFDSKTYYLYDPAHPCGADKLYVAWIGDKGFPGAIGSEMKCGQDGQFSIRGKVSSSVREFYFIDQLTTSIPGVHVWGDSNKDKLIDLDGTGIRTYEPSALGADLEVKIDLRSLKYSVNILTPYRRTVILIYGKTKVGQDMFIRGGIDHDQGNARGRNCSKHNFNCAIPIRHRNMRNDTTSPWKTGDSYLDWYGREGAQDGWSHGIQAEGTPADWTTDHWPSSWGPTRTVAVDGYGYESLNIYGQHYWMLDVDMDCSKGFGAQDGTAWFELKTYISGGPGWEGDVSQAGSPYQSRNHFAKCGMINVFRRGSSDATFVPFN